MQKITTITELKSAIQLLEDQQINEWPILKEEFLSTYESLKPVNLIKSVFNELTKGPELKDGIINATLSLAAGYISKKITIGSTSNPLKQLLGTFIQMGVSKIVSRNTDEIKSIGSLIFKKIIHRSPVSEKEQPDSEKK